MILEGIVSCVRTLAFRIFPVFPRLQVALPAITNTPFTIINQREERRQGDLAKWLQESFLQFAAPKKRASIQKRRQRRATKNLERKTAIVVCPKCGKFKLLHHLCNSCVLHNRYNGESREY
ncbi:hypothetical protein WA588_000307 [Blastocystis sp. NMH]